MRGRWAATESVFHFRAEEPQSDRVNPITHLEVPMSTVSVSTPHPFVSHQGEARWYAGNLFEFLVPAATTGGELSLMRMTCRPGGEPPRHVHTQEDELFYILEGDVCFEIGGRRQLAGPGSSVHAPRGVPHGFRFESHLVRMLGVLTPGRLEDMFRTFSVPAQERALPPAGEYLPDFGALAADMAARGVEILGPPVGAEA